MKGRGLGVFFVLFSLLFIGIGAWQAEKQAQALRGFKTTDARVLAVSIDVSHGSKGDSYTPRVRYRYQVNGRSYESNQVLPIKISSSRSWARGYTDRYSPGQATIAYYNPADASEAFLVHEASFLP